MRQQQSPSLVWIAKHPGKHPGGHRNLVRVKENLVALLLLLAMGGVVACRADSTVLPKGTNLNSLMVINENNLGSTAQGVMIATLQGLVARQSGSQIYIVGSSAGYSIWYNHLKNAYGIPYTTTSNPWSLVDQYRNLVSGYVLYDGAVNSNSLNAATSLCGPFNAIAVDASIEGAVRSHGITNRLVDVRTRDEAWVWTNYNSMLSRSMVVEQKESIGANLRDYAAMAGAFTFFDGNSSFRTFVMSQMAPDAACLGWGDSSLGEQIPIGDCSSNGVYTVGSDWAENLSTLSSISDNSIYQRTYTKPMPSPETNVQYVTFVVTDGDNVQWNIGDLAGYFNNLARGSFNMGWSISPSLFDLAPSVLRWYFDNSSNGPNRDVFVAGTSGSGYFYPSMYPPADLDLHVQKLNAYMDSADLTIVLINDFNSFGRLDLWNKYLAQPNINGLFYLEYSLYSATGGAMLFSTNGRPVIGARDLLWAGVEEDTNVIANINSYPRDPSSPAGYTLVMVHVWDKNLGDVQNVVTNLSADVRVVTPDVFVNLILNNVGRKLSYDFGTGLQGWAGWAGSGPSDKASWTSTAGNPAGALLLDGSSDLGHAGSYPNSFFYRQVILPCNATALSFDTCADNDGLLCVLLAGADGALVQLIGWEKLAATNTWVTRTASLTNYAGQTVAFYFLQTGGGQGVGEARYVDNIAVLTDGPPLYIPAAPKLLTVTAANCANLVWRDNDNNEAGFKIERSTGTNGVWVEIANVSSNVTTYVDTTVSAGTNYSYRLRSWNAGGCSAYSNVRTVVTPPRPAVSVALAGSSLGLNWPSWATNFTLYATTNLAAAAIWSPVTNAVTNLNGSFNVTVPLAPGDRFFQLRSQ